MTPRADAVRAMSKLIRRSPRAFALWLVALLSSVWPLAAWHELTTTHAVCAEHGEVLDLVHHGEGEHEDGPRAIDIEHDEHDPCAFAPLAQPGRDEGTAPPQTAPALLVGSSLEPGGAPRAQRFPRYLLAPKQSPPRGSSS